MIPFLDLKAQYRQMKPEIDAAVARAIESTQFVLGPEVDGIRGAFRRLLQRQALRRRSIAARRHLHLALLAAGVGPGDEVITVSMTFVATTAAILYSGAKPVFVDVDPVTWTMDPSLIEAAITPRTKAILPVHLHGLMADMDRSWRSPAPRARRDRGRGAGAWCRIQGPSRRIDRRFRLFQLLSRQELGAYGEGGAVVTNQPEFARRIALLRDWGQETKYNHVVPVTTIAWTESRARC